MSRTPIGIFGGTFDPIHYGHLRLAEEILEQADLAQIRFVPNGNPPHRNKPKTPAHQRSEMVRLALNDQTAFVLDEREVQRQTPCYTVDTLREIRNELGPEQSICLLMGGDAFFQLHTWHAWQELFELAHIVVGHRPGYTLSGNLHTVPESLRQQYLQRRCNVATLSQHAAGGIIELAIPKLDISATLIRSKVAEGHSIRYLLPQTVADYIQQHSLYLPC